jgi:hypothetical protein
MHSRSALAAIRSALASSLVGTSIAAQVSAVASAPPPATEPIPSSLAAAREPVPVGKWRAEDASSEAIAAQSPATSDTCDVGIFAPLPETCSTPRKDFITGNFGLDFGLATLEPDASNRISSSRAGVAATMRLGIALSDVVAVNAIAGAIAPKDRDPFEEMVQECTEHIMDSCSEPWAEESGVAGYFVGLEAGLQHRFRPSGVTSMVPGALLGHALAVGNFTRSVACNGCESVDLDAAASGTYGGPFFRVTFGRMGMFSVILRSMWFLHGDLEQVSTLGGEFGLP